MPRLGFGRLIAALAAGTVMLPLPVTATQELSGHIALETRVFPEKPLSPEQFETLNFSLTIEPEYYIEWQDGDQRLTVTAFLRLDQNDRDRTHFDIRELYWEKFARSWELRIGIQKFFWGVTETQHLVDVLNQTDFVENIDGEDKLGEPMVSVASIRDWGTVKIFLMPFFRERTFAGRRGRLRTIPRVDSDRTTYASAAKETHFDCALRYSHYISVFDFGLSHFSGTSREPAFGLAFDAAGAPVLVPHYDTMDQTALDLQATTGGWLWKLEALSNERSGGRYTAAAGGLEYTLIGLFGSVYDLGLLGEYHFDDRGRMATTPFQDDVFAGTRLAFNDTQDTAVLSGASFDLNTATRFYFVEASRRLRQSWTLDVELRVFENVHERDIFSSTRNDSHLQIELAWHF